MRTCKQCGQVGVEGGSFYRSVTTYCKECWKAKVRERRQNDPSAREYDRARANDPARKASLARNSERWRKEFPEKARAHRAVAYAKRKGTLVPPEKCQGCKKPHDSLHAHHDDYSKALDVTWYCPRCHSVELRKGF